MAVVASMVEGYGGGSFECHHVLDPVPDVVVDVSTCSRDDAEGVSGRVVNAIVAKVAH